MFKARHISVSIARTPHDVYAFTSNPANLSRWITWAKARQSGEDWILDSPDGPMVFRFVPSNDLGVLDHQVTLPDGQQVLNPMRVIPNADGSEVTFTLYQRPAMSDDSFAEDARAVETDLNQLKRVLEG